MRLLLFLILNVAVHAATITGKVVSVADGDTITVLTATQESVKIRLYGIDAPEAKQAFGTRAKQELSELVAGKTVTVNVRQKDRYGRSVGVVTVGSMAINLEMVRRGFAWWYRDYAKKDVELAKAEAEARNGKRGLWIDKAPVAPWEFRQTGSAKRKKVVTQIVTETPVGDSILACNSGVSLFSQHFEVYSLRPTQIFS